VETGIENGGSMPHTVDFHVTSECSQECPYCWGPQGIDAVDTAAARSIVTKIAAGGAGRIVFTGGDPLARSDLAELIRHARAEGLEVAVSTTGDRLDASFLAHTDGCIDLVSLPLDGSNEAVSSRTKKPGHLAAVMGALDLLAAHPDIDTKIATPVTRHNLEDVPRIVELIDRAAEGMRNRLFYNVFQAFPRSMDDDVDWSAMVVSAEEFSALRDAVEARPHRFPINWLDHRTLDRLYVMVFPDGRLTVPSGSDFLDYGPFLEIPDLDVFLEETDFDAAKHRRHSRGWTRSAPTEGTVTE
jgi:MoaA/NifB/PqqE/SkfB family radical SAM enzyme